MAPAAGVAPAHQLGLAKLHQPPWQQPQQSRVVWRGRPRDFPDELNINVEHAYQSDEVAVEFVWPNKQRTQWTPYRILFDRMVQINLHTQQERRIARSMRG